jgi:hypothetical protein
MKPLIAFVAGMFTVAIAAAVSGSHAVVLALGFVAGTVTGARSARLLRCAAARLEAVARWIEPAAVAPVRVSKVDTKPADPRESELTSALINLGSHRRPAAAAARYAIESAPAAATIPELVRIALKAPQGVAA